MITVITGFSCIVSYISVISNEKLMVVIVLPIQILDTKLSRFRVLLICECASDCQVHWIGQCDHPSISAGYPGNP